jgi:hypothetical protein
MGSTWVEHRVFALSMQVYGSVHNYVMNMLGKAVMVEDVEKYSLSLLPKEDWKRFFIPCEQAVSVLHIFFMLYLCTFLFTHVDSNTMYNEMFSFFNRECLLNNMKILARSQIFYQMV